jgi:RNA polymerase sigma factor (sigma-70 family)
MNHHGSLSEGEGLAEQFEDERPRLRAVAYRMLGSLNEADDALQEAWLRLSRQDAAMIENLNGWLTTVVARVCLNMLKARRSRREEPVGVQMPDPVVSYEDGADPVQHALLADSVGLALLVVLETLEPAERLAFVLHDMFAVPFDEIAPIVGRSSAAARQLASRARRRVHGAAPVSDVDLAAQREVVDAFVAAARAGDFEALIKVLDPDVVLRADIGTRRPAGMTELRSAEAVARAALSFSSLGLHVRAAVINGAAGTVSVRDGKLVSVAGFTVRRGRITEIDILADPERLRRFDAIPDR